MRVRMITERISGWLSAMPVVPPTGRAFATKAIFLFNYSQKQKQTASFGSPCILVISRHPGSVFARCPSANPRRCNKGFFSSVTLTLNVSSASEVKSFEPQLVSRLVAIGALRLLRNSLGISPHFRQLCSFRYIFCFVSVIKYYHTDFIKSTYFTKKLLTKGQKIQGRFFHKSVLLRSSYALSDFINL